MNGQPGKGDKVRPRDPRYCTSSEWRERWGRAFEDAKKRRQERREDRDGPKRT
jgi:hypothetical protein